MVGCHLKAEERHQILAEGSWDLSLPCPLLVSWEPTDKRFPVDGLLTIRKRMSNACAAHLKVKSKFKQACTVSVCDNGKTRNIQVG